MFLGARSVPRVADHRKPFTVHARLRRARYQLAFLTPGIIPKSASSRKQIRQRPKRRRKARERPQRPQRLCTRTWNFGFRLLFSIMAFRAIAVSLPLSDRARA